MEPVVFSKWISYFCIAYILCPLVTWSIQSFGAYWDSRCNIYLDYITHCRAWKFNWIPCRLSLFTCNPVTGAIPVLSCIEPAVKGPCNSSVIRGLFLLTIPVIFLPAGPGLWFLLRFKGANFLPSVIPMISAQRLLWLWIEWRFRHIILRCR